MTEKWPRGIRNNNPGNIRKSKIDWKGEVKGVDALFESFDSMEDGVRAIFMILLHYIRKDGLDTIWEIISKWAPPNENLTTAYVNEVCKFTGMEATQPVEPTFATLGPICHAITIVENGGDFIEPAIFKKAWDLTEV